MTALQAPDGQPTKSVPANNATIFVQLVAGGTVVFSNSYLTGSNGVTTVKLPNTLGAAQYTLSILADSPTSKLIKPYVTSITISSASSTSSSSSSTTSTTSSSSTTSTTTSSINTTLYIGVAVVVLLVIVAAGFLFSRRRKV